MTPRSRPRFRWAHSMKKMNLKSSSEIAAFMLVKRERRRKRGSAAGRSETEAQESRQWLFFDRMSAEDGRRCSSTI